MNVPFAIKFLGVLALAITGTLISSSASALSCPPPAAAGPAGPIPGKAGETGWKLNSEPDDKGNLVETWCLQPNAKHGGDDFGYLWKPKVGNAVWVGACVFGCGRNKPNKQFVDKDDGKGGGKPNGVPDEFTKLTWLNAEPPPAGTKDWDFSFDTGTGKLRIGKTEGKWSDPYVDPKDGKTKRKYESTEIDSDTIDAPENFEDLKFKGTQLTSLNGSDGLGAEAFAALLNPSASGTLNFTLLANALGGDGTPADPFDGVITSIFSGDTFTIGAREISNPFVTGLALLPAFGAWHVGAFDDSFVSYVASTSVDFSPGTDISGFGFNSLESGMMSWDLASTNELASSSGTIDEPRILALLGVAFLAMIRIVRVGVTLKQSPVGRNNQQALRRMCFIRCNALRLLHYELIPGQGDLIKGEHRRSAVATQVEHTALFTALPRCKPRGTRRTALDDFALTDFHHQYLNQQITAI